MKKNSMLLKVLCGCLGLALVLPLAVNAEPNGTSQFEIGLKTGLAMGSIAGDDSENWEKTRSGFYGSAFARFAASDVVSFEMDFGYIQKGGKAEIPVMDMSGEQIGTVEATLVLNRLELAPTVVFTLPVEGQIRPSLFGGISMAFGGSSEVETEGYDSEDISEVTESSNLGFVLGAEVAYQLPSARVFADFRFSRDFGSVNKTDMFDWVSQVISFGVGVGFKI